jgi:hypothetical protein
MATPSYLQEPRFSGVFDGSLCNRFHYIVKKNWAPVFGDPVPTTF